MHRGTGSQTVRYHFVNAMLLNEVQKQHGRIADLEAQLAEQRQRAAALEARLARLEAQAEERIAAKP
ncbi:MAG: hypothetical protein M3O15_01845 [Acidobacteriota bacterium]|nr:hypothetical protein [Acidobacteriota bacterium]